MRPDLRPDHIGHFTNVLSRLFGIYAEVTLRATMARQYRVDGRFYWLSLAGIGFQVVSWTIIFLTWLYPLEMNHWMTPLGMDPSTMNHWVLTTGGMISAPGMLFVAVLGLGLISLGLIGVRMARSFQTATTRVGGLVLIISALLAYPTAWGFFAGSILMLLGGFGVLGDLASRRFASEQSDFYQRSPASSSTF